MTQENLPMRPAGDCRPPQSPISSPESDAPSPEDTNTTTVIRMLNNLTNLSPAARTDALQQVQQFLDVAVQDPEIDLRRNDNNSRRSMTPAATRGTSPATSGKPSTPVTTPEATTTVPRKRKHAETEGDDADPDATLSANGDGDGDGEDDGGRPEPKHHLGEQDQAAAQDGGNVPKSSAQKPRKPRKPKPSMDCTRTWRYKASNGSEKLILRQSGPYVQICLPLKDGNAEPQKKEQERGQEQNGGPRYEPDKGSIVVRILDAGPTRREQHSHQQRLIARAAIEAANAAAAATASNQQERGDNDIGSGSGSNQRRPATASSPPPSSYTAAQLPPIPVPARCAWAVFFARGSRLNRTKLVTSCQHGGLSGRELRMLGMIEAVLYSLKTVSGSIVPTVGILTGNDADKRVDKVLLVGSLRHLPGIQDLGLYVDDLEKGRIDKIPTRLRDGVAAVLAEINILEGRQPPISVWVTRRLIEARLVSDLNQELSDVFNNHT